MIFYVLREIEHSQEWTNSDQAPFQTFHYVALRVQINKQTGLYKNDLDWEVSLNSAWKLSQVRKNFKVHPIIDILMLWIKREYKLY